MNTSENLKEMYNQWVMKEFDYNEINKNVIRIDTPFFDRRNDSLILYAIVNNDNKTLVLTDGGYIIDDLESSGVYINKSTKRKALLKSQLLSYGVSLDKEDNSLFIKSTYDQFPVNKQRLIQAMLFTNDMFLTSKKNNNSVFFEDVSHFLEENNIRAMHNISITGESGMIHKFEFSISGIRDIPDKLIKTLNIPNNELYAKALTADVKNASEVVSRPTKFYAFVNDQEKPLKNSIVSLLSLDDISIIPFSKREKFIKELAK